MTPKEIVSHLRRLEIQPSKGLGQNFLHDRNLARRFASFVHPEEEGLIVEIGPGLGSLTSCLTGQKARVLAIERDTRLADFLKSTYPPDLLEVRREDATRFDLRTLYGNGPVRVIGNLPYAVSTPLIDHFTSPLSPASLLVLGLQRELAERLGASPGTRAYGAMTVRMQRRWHMRVVHRLPGSVFIPAPKVESAILEMRLRLPHEMRDCDAVQFDRLVRQGFSSRRKQLRNLLDVSRERWREVATHLGVPETVRGEALDMDQWVGLTNFLYPLSQDQNSSEERLSVVDAHDHVIGEGSRKEVHVNNLRHRAVHILVFNAKNELFLQKRSWRKDRNPGLWDTSAAGHVAVGESVEESAQRELSEELGIEAPLKFLTKLPASPETGEEFISIFRVDHDGPMRLSPFEIETGAFFPLPQIRAWMQATPCAFTSTFRMCFAKGVVHF